MKTLLVLLAAALTLFIVPTDLEDPAAGAVERSLEYLLADGEAWMRGESAIQSGSGCISCHHVGFTLWSHEEAASAGLSFDQTRLDALRDDAIDFLTEKDDALRVVSSAQLAMTSARSPHLLSVIEEKSVDGGRWDARGQFFSQRRGRDEGDHVQSLWAIVALQQIEEPSDATKKRLTQAQRWMGQMDKPGSSTEWLIARLVADPKPTWRKQLLQEQNDDGGWGWMAGEESNAMSTGQALYALAVTANDEQDAQRAAIEYLLRTQRADGSWLTPSELISAEPSHEKEEIYQYWGSAWASIGMSRALRNGDDPDTSSSRWQK